MPAGFGRKPALELEDAIRQGFASGVAVVSSDDIQGGEGGCSNGRGWSGGEDERAAVVDQILSERPAAGRKPASDAEGLTQGSDENIRSDAGLMTQAAPTRPEDAKGVRLIDNQGCSVFLGQRREGRQGSDVTVHAKEGLGDQEFPAGGRREGEQPFLGGGKVEMAVESRPGSRKPAGVDDTGVVGVVAQNQVARACQGCENAKVGLVARGKEEHGFHIQEGGEAGLEFTMLGQIAGYQARGTGTKSRAGNGSGGSGGQGRVA